MLATPPVVTGGSAHVHNTFAQSVRETRLLFSPQLKESGSLASLFS